MYGSELEWRERTSTFISSLAALPYPPEVDKAALVSYWGGWWWVREEFEIHEVLGSTVVIPKGFRTDLASIPRPFRGYFASPHELGVESAVLHDWLYRVNGVLPPDGCRPARMYTRRDSDDAFLVEMRRRGVNEIRSVLSHRAVRLGAGRQWRKWGRQPLVLSPAR